MKQEKLTLDNIKDGDIFYHVFRDKITRYRYVGLHPDNRSYHIVINQTSCEPERIYKATLNIRLFSDIRSYKQALEQVVKNINSSLIFWEEALEAEKNRLITK